MVYGQGQTIDVDRMIDMLTALEKFIAVKDADGSAFKVDGKRGGVDVESWRMRVEQGVWLMSEIVEQVTMRHRLCPRRVTTPL